MEQLVKTWSQVKVVLSNLLTYLVILQTTLTFLVANGELDAWPEALRWILLVLGVLGTVIGFIRRVAPVDKDERGLLDDK